MKTPRGDWRRSSEEYWLQATLLFSLALVGFRGKLPSGLPLLSHKGDSKVLEQLLRLLEVRALGTLSFPAARVAPWLAQEEGGEVPAPPTSGAADGGRCREAREPLLAARRQSRRPRPPQETLEAGAASPDPGEKKRGLSPEAVDLKGRQEYLEYCYLLPKENEYSESQGGGGQKECDKSEGVDWKERENPTSVSLNHRSTIDSSFSLEGYFPQLTSLSEIALEEHVSNSGGVNLTNFQNPIDLAQAISHDVSLHDATVMGSDHPNVTNAERRNLEILPDLNTFPTNGTNMLELFAYDNCCRNLTNQDFFFSLNANGFEEINFTSLTMEENSDSPETCLFEEWDSDSGLSLDINYSNSSLVFTYNKGAKSGTSDDSGTVGDGCLERGKCCRTEYRSNYDYGTESLVGVFHDHTYNQNTQQLTLSMSQDYFRWPEESIKTEKDKNLNDDEYRANALRIPFSVKDIVTLPVDSFNSMLSNYYLTANQLSLIRDIRRRGKNKVAAQNCRKRKLDAIMNLKDEVCHLQMRMERLKKQKAQYKRSISNIKQKLNELCWDFFSKLRDDQGKRVNPSQYTLQCCGNGTILILPEKEINLEPTEMIKMRDINI